MKRLTLLLATAALGLLATPPLAHADFGLTAAGLTASTSTTQAGAHGDVSVSFAFNTHPDPVSVELPDDNAKATIVNLPAGFAGNPAAFPRCSVAFLQAHEYCPAETQVGVIHYTIVYPGIGPVPPVEPIYNMVPSTGHVAEFAFMNHFVASIEVNIQVSVRTDSDYGITASIPALPSQLQALGATVTMWGVPGDPSHDSERGSAIFDPHGCLVFNGESICSLPSGLPARPFLANPTQCTTPGSIELSTDSYQNPADFLTYKSESQQMEGCDKLAFSPSIAIEPTSHEAGAPAGLDVRVHIPQPWAERPDLLATAHLRKTVVTLPEGMSVNPAQAEGLGACTPAQIGIEDDAEPSCPDSSKIGTVEVDTPVLSGPLQGSVYLAKQIDNPFGSLLAIYLAVEGQGVLVKLPGKIEADPQTGQLTTTFDESPQLPFEDFHLRFFGGQRAALINPPTCGTYTSQASLTSWADSTPVDLQSSFQLTSGPGGSPCGAQPFNPGFEAGATTPIAGAFSPFVLKLSREDGSQEFRSIDATLPPGMVGKLAGIPYCPDSALAAVSGALGTGAAQLASPSCPVASRVGRVIVGAGAGSPFYVGGTAYLAGPYHGAPLSLAIVTPVLAGPFDLGNVVVRTALEVNPETAQITAVSDEIPHILYGIPLDVRDIRVSIDRPDFTLNPTSCDPMAVTGVLGSLQGASADVSDRFQVGACAALGFKPGLHLHLKGGTHRGSHPALRAALTMPSGDADIARAAVTLPHSEFLEQAHIRTVCTRVQFAAGACPKGSVYGHARAFTPLLDQPLEGPVYLRSSDNPLPDLVADLDGQIHIVLDGRIDSHKGGIRTTFATVPDAPVSKFVLTMKGGAKGLLVNSTDLCRSTNRATVKMDAHNGKIHDFSPPVRAAGCGGSGRAGR